LFSVISGIIASTLAVPEVPLRAKMPSTCSSLVSAWNERAGM